MFPDIAPATWQAWSLAALVVFMLNAVDSDVRQHRIPNFLVFLMLGTGLLLQGLGPEGGREGLFSSTPGALGMVSAVAGGLLGLALFLPFYLLHAMGAGDVKLMAALGVFAGPRDTIGLALAVLLAGGALAVGRMAWTGRTRLVLRNVKWALSSLTGSDQRFDPALQSVDRMPYALSFAGGVLLYACWRLTDSALLLRF